MGQHCSRNSVGNREIVSKSDLLSDNEENMTLNSDSLSNPFTLLDEIAKEYARKRALGLIPTRPVPARTLLWEEISRRNRPTGERGGCIFGRDSIEICNCREFRDEENTGQCSRCGHGSCWHKRSAGGQYSSIWNTGSFQGEQTNDKRLHELIEGTGNSNYSKHNHSAILSFQDMASREIYKEISDQKSVTLGHMYI